MSKKITYTCDICRDETPKQQVMGCNFSGMKKFKLDTPESTDGVHICMSCLDQLRVQLGPKRSAVSEDGDRVEWETRARATRKSIVSEEAKP